MEKTEVLRQYFGYASFRKGQEALIDSILEGRDTLGIMPTGAGKSLCFQVPALMLEGVTLVISPLISLMKDQVSALCQAGIRAAYLNSSLTYPQYRKALANACAGVYKIIYVAPERLLTEEFLAFSHRVRIALVTVDEAHCISQWGQDFRPSYLKVPEFVAQLDERPVLAAFTATATEEVKRDIAAMLSLRDPFTITTGFNRDNLYFEVDKPPDKMAALLRYLRDNPGKSGIVYCTTRKTVEEVCQKLPSAWGSTNPTWRSSCITTCRGAWRPTIRRRGARDGMGSPPSVSCITAGKMWRPTGFSSSTGKALPMRTRRPPPACGSRIRSG